MPEWIHLALTGAVAVVGLMIRNQVGDLRAEMLRTDRDTRDWVLEHFETKGK